MRRYWSSAARSKFRRLYPSKTCAELSRQFKRSRSSIKNLAVKMGLHKTPAFIAACRLQPGCAAWNKGKTGYMGANAKSFRKGHRPQTWRPVGSERVNPDGTLERKVANPGRWKPVKTLIWIAANGRIPRGRFVVHADRDRSNFDLSNLELVSRAENMRRNTYHRYPKEIADLIQLRGALQRQINKRESRRVQQN